MCRLFSGVHPKRTPGCHVRTKKCYNGSYTCQIRKGYRSSYSYEDLEKEMELFRKS